MALTQTEALKEALDIIEWMSGSADFAPGGQAYDGWQSAQGKIADIKVAIMQSTKIKLVPEWARFELQAFAMSPSTGLQQRITVGGRRDLDLAQTDFDGLHDIVVSTLNDLGNVSDARVMTADEVRDYDKPDTSEEDDDEGDED